MFVYKLRLLIAKTYPNFVRTDQFLRDLQSKQIFRQSDKQTLNCHMATKWTMVPKWKGDFSTKKNY